MCQGCILAQTSGPRDASEIYYCSNKTEGNVGYNGLSKIVSYSNFGGYQCLN